MINISCQRTLFSGDGQWSRPYIPVAIIPGSNASDSPYDWTTRPRVERGFWRLARIVWLSSYHRPIMALPIMTTIKLDCSQSSTLAAVTWHHVVMTTETFPIQTVGSCVSVKSTSHGFFCRTDGCSPDRLVPILVNLPMLAGAMGAV